MTEVKKAASATSPGTKVIDHSFASLDMMRGLSAFAVLVSHAASLSGYPEHIYGLYYGAFAVDVFMLISGFLMMWHFYERKSIGESWSNPKTTLKFYTRRFFRIAPLYYFLLTVTYLFYPRIAYFWHYNHAMLHESDIYDPANPTWGHLSLAHILAHYSFVFGFIPSYGASDALPDWSIGLEMQFYLFFPFLALLLDRTKFIGGVVLLVGLNLLALHFISVGEQAVPRALGNFPYPSFLPLRLCNFLAGMLLAAGLFTKDNLRKRTFLLLLGLVVAGIYMKKFLIVCFIFTAYEIAARNETGIPLVNHFVKGISAFVRLRLFKFMGEASYGVYLIHMSLISLVLYLLLHTSPFVTYAPVVRFLICLGVIVPIVYALAFLTFKLIEAPGITLGRKIVKSIR